MTAGDRLRDVLRRHFAERPLDVCVIGSRSAKDYDVVVVGRDPFPDRVTYSFLQGLRHVLDECSYNVIARPEHRLSFPEGTPILHIIYYTSYEHLAVCEVPSFLASVYDTGEFLCGDGERLAEATEAYRDRRARCFSHADLQAARYAELATMSLIYLAAGTRPFPELLLKELLLYVLRFTFVERISEIEPLEPASAWSWPGLLKSMDAHCPEQRTAITWFRRRDEHSWQPSVPELERGFYAALRLLGPEGRSVLNSDVVTQISPSAER